MAKMRPVDNDPCDGGDSGGAMSSSQTHEEEDDLVTKEPTQNSFWTGCKRVFTRSTRFLGKSRRGNVDLSACSSTTTVDPEVASTSKEAAEDALFYADPLVSASKVKGCVCVRYTTTNNSSSNNNNCNSSNAISCPPMPTVPEETSTFLHLDGDDGETVPLSSEGGAAVQQAHTQVDYVHYLIPGQGEIVKLPFYWGKMDRYEAEALLADKPEGSFLLRDSAQDDFVFSVSFRRYSRSLHARIEETGHKFSFDCHDPGVHAAKSIRGLLDHYKDPLSCMFFEPMLLFPVNRKTTFSLQGLARTAICDRISYNDVSKLPLPTPLKQYLREYHYRHKIRTRHLVDTVDTNS